jgi:VWFA-related protein
VVDNKTGKAVPDLKAEDFTLTEDGAAQPIRLFERHALKPDAAPAPGTRLAMREVAFGSAPQNNRIFLIVLGRGKLQEPSKALDALLRFIRQNLLPQDQVAVFAYDRATDFTTDHEAIARLVERFKAQHYDIDLEVKLQVESGMARLYGSGALPKNLQNKIDTLFGADGALASRQVGRADNAATKRAETDSVRAANDLQRADANSKITAANDELTKNIGPGGPTGGLPNWSAIDEVTSQMFTTLAFDDFMQANAQSLQDLSNCYAGIEYMRHLEGEKHLVFVTERGMTLPRLEDDLDLAKSANDARVAIDTFQTGGVEGQQGGNVQTAQNMDEGFRFKTLRTIAELTGGVSSIAEKGDVAVDRIDDMTKTDYVIGYYPSMARLDGSYRKIEVKVNRPDSTVLYRHGYFARRDIGSFDRRTFITAQRLQAAAGFSREIKDIKLKLNAGTERVQGQQQLVVNLNIDVAKLAMSVEKGEHVGVIDILVVAADDKGNVVGQNYQRAGLKFTEEMWQKLVKNGIPYNARMDVNAGVRQVRVIVYDYRADLIGRADARVY